jgi:hypothetical protein
MASKNAKRNTKNFMNGPFFVVILVIAAIVAVIKLIAG